MFVVFLCGDCVVVELAVFLVVAMIDVLWCCQCIVVVEMRHGCCVPSVVNLFSVTSFSSVFVLCCVALWCCICVVGCWC